MNLDLRGKTAFVCGASRGIGRAVAQELAEMGARLVLLARDSQGLAAVQSSLPSVSGEGHRSLAVDFSDLPELIDLVRDLLKEIGPVHILVGNSGGPPGGPLLEAKPDEFLQAFQQHILANHLLAQLLVPKMIEAKYGRIINIISTSVKEPIPQLGVSNTIRGAVASWAKTLSVELGPYGITVNNLLPGYTATDRLDSLLKQAANRQKKSVQEVSLEWQKRVPLGRFADPAETAQAVAFLASPSGAYINGINLPVDGGRLGCL